MWNRWSTGDVVYSSRFERVYLQTQLADDKPRQRSEVKRSHG